MTARTLPGIGLTGDIEQGAPWKVAGDRNWLLSSVLTQLAVESATTSLPVSPLNGVIYIVPAADANGNQVAARDNGAWVYFPPFEGLTAYVRDTGVLMNFDGAAWVLPTAAHVATADGGTVQDALDGRPTSEALALPDASNGLGFLQAGTGAVGRTSQSKMRDVISVKDYGAVGDGVTDDQPAIQAAIDFANAISPKIYPFQWITVMFPHGIYYCATPLTQKTGVMLASEGFGRAGAATILGNGAQVITTPVGRQTNIGIAGLKITGASSAARIGVLWQDVAGSTISNVTVSNVQDQGIRVVAGVANHYRHIFIVNALLDRTRVTEAGAFHIGDFDPSVDTCEITGSAAGDTVATAGLYNIAMLIASSSGFFSNILGQFGDVAWKVTGANNRFSNCRADAALGHGAIFNGSTNVATNFGVLNCGSDVSVGADVWDAVQINSTSNRIAGLDVQKSTGLRGRYVANIASFSEVRTRSAISNITVNTAAPGYLSKFNVSLVADGVPSVALDPSGYITQRTGANLDLQNAAVMRLLYTAPENITTVTNAIPGQIYTLFLNANATIVAGASFALKDASVNIVGGGATLALQKTVQFIANSSTAIKEIGR